MVNSSQSWEFDAFVSYSHFDNNFVKQWLLPRLEGAQLRVCIDDRDFTFGRSVLVNIEDAVERSRYIILILTPDWLTSKWTQFESVIAQIDDPAGISKQRLIPILVSHCELPRRLGSLTFADFRLEQTREAELRRVLRQISALPNNIQEHTDDQQRSRAHTCYNMDQVSRPQTMPRSNLGEARAVDVFLGRTEEQAILNQWIVTDRCRLVAIVGMAGIGKTHLSLKVARDIQNDFEYVKWLTLEDAPPLPEVLKDVLWFFSNQTEFNLPTNVDDQISRLFHYFRQHRCLLILDNVETLLKGGNGAGQYLDGYEEYDHFFQRVGEVNHNSCLLMTTREQPQTLERLAGLRPSIRFLRLRGLGRLEGRNLFTAIGHFHGSDNEWGELIDWYDGNPLFLELAAKHIAHAFDGNIRAFLKEGRPVFKGLDFLDWYFDRFSDAETAIVYWLAITREPVSRAELAQAILPPQATQQIPDTIESLARLLRLEQRNDCITLQPALKEYTINRFIKLVTDEIREERLALLNSHALLNVNAPEYVRKTQRRLILGPLIKQLEACGIDIEAHLTVLLKGLPRSRPKPMLSYAAGNILNLFICLQIDLTGYDFSQLTVWQADLRNVRLHRVNFSYSDLSKSAFSEPFDRAFALAFNGDGKVLATGHTDGEICLWDFEKKVQHLRWKGHEGWIHSIAFSPTAPTLATGAGGNEKQTLRIWDAQNGQELNSWKASSKEVHSVAFSPDGTILASGSEDSNIKLWDAETYSAKPLKTLRGHGGWVQTLVFSPDGHTLASGSWDKTVKLWDPKTGLCRKTLAHDFHGDTRVEAVAFNPAGTILASGSYDGAVRLWDVGTGGCLKTWVGHDKAIWALAFSPVTRNVLASSSVDNKVRLWNAQTGECIHTLEHNDWIHSIAFSHDGSVVVSASYEPSVRVWDVSKGRCLEFLPGYVNCVHSVSFTQHGKVIASCSEDQIVRLWNLDVDVEDIVTDDYRIVLDGHSEKIYSLAFSPDDCMMASGNADGTVDLWDISADWYKPRLYKHLKAHEPGGISVTFSCDGKRMASSSGDTTIKLWDVKTGKCDHTLKGHTRRARSVAFSPDGETLVSGGDDWTVRVWDLRAEQHLIQKCLTRKHGSEVPSVAFSPNEPIFASGSWDKTVKVWDEKGHCLKTLGVGESEHKDWILSIAFSPDGLSVASGSEDCKIKIWNIKTGECCRTLHGHERGIRRVAFMPGSDGILASCSDDETIKIWDTKNGNCKKTLRCERLYEAMDITGTSATTNRAGLTIEQIAHLRDLGAILGHL